MTTDNTFQYDTPTNSVEALRRAIANRLVYQVGKDLRSATQRDWLFAVFHAVRDRIMTTWRESLVQAEDQVGVAVVIEVGDREGFRVAVDHDAAARALAVARAEDGEAVDHHVMTAPHEDHPARIGRHRPHERCVRQSDLCSLDRYHWSGIDNSGQQPCAHPCRLLIKRWRVLDRDHPT